MTDQEAYSLPVRIVELEEGGYLATCEDIQGCHAEGDTIAEAIENIEDVARVLIELCLEERLPLPPELQRQMPAKIRANLIDRA